MKGSEMQLSHSLLFPLKLKYFSTKIQHMCGYTWKQGELMNPGEQGVPAFAVRHPGSARPLPNSAPMDSKCNGKTHFTAEKESQKITQAPDCHLLIMPADRILRSKTGLVGQCLHSLKL